MKSLYSSAVLSAPQRPYLSDEELIEECEVEVFKAEDEMDEDIHHTDEEETKVGVHQCLCPVTMQNLAEMPLSGTRSVCVLHIDGGVLREAALRNSSYRYLWHELATLDVCYIARIEMVDSVCVLLRESAHETCARHNGVFAASTREKLCNCTSS
ncbi:hypothetical protein Tco_0318390 [Tanacetum coccineum]